MPNTVIVTADEQSAHVEDIKMYIISRGVLDVIKGVAKPRKKNHMDTGTDKGMGMGTGK